MPQTSGGWTHQQLHLRLSRPFCRQYASIPKHPEKRIIANRPPERGRLRVVGKPTFEPQNQTNPVHVQQRLNLQERLTPQFLRTRPYWRKFLFRVAVFIPIGAFALTHLPFTSYPVYGPSMRPTLNPDCECDNDTLYKPMRVIVQKWTPNTSMEIVRRSNTTDEIYTGRYKRGDIIVYWAPHNPNRIGVKRIVGLPGDSVTPIKGYNGEENPAPVIIPFNHLWIEGDANDRKLSVDSNYFGPISQALVQGRVTAKWSPWWNVLGIREVDSGNKGWPARNQGRIVEGAVHEATMNPDALSRKLSFGQGQQSEAILHYLKQQPTRFLERWEDDSEAGAQFRIMVRRLSTTAYDVAKGHEDKETRERARHVWLELQRLVGNKALSQAATSAQVVSGQKGKRWTPSKPEDQQNEDLLERNDDLFADLIVPEDERAKEREARANPAGSALKKILEQKKQLSDALDKEHEELDKAKLQRSGYAE